MKEHQNVEQALRLSLAMSRCILYQRHYAGLTACALLAFYDAKSSNYNESLSLETVEQSFGESALMVGCLNEPDEEKKKKKSRQCTLVKPLPYTAEPWALVLV